MRTPFRCFWLGIILLAVAAAITSCKKPKEIVAEKAAEPWVVASVLEWGEGPQDPAELASSFVVYSDRQFIIKRLGQKFGDKPTFWTRILSQEEFEEIDSAVNDVLRAGANQASFESGINWMEGGVSSLYFGIPGKGAIFPLNGIQLFALEKHRPSDLLLILEGAVMLPEVKRYCRTILDLSKGDFVHWEPNSITIHFQCGPIEHENCVQWPDDWPKPEFSIEPSGIIPDWVCVKLPLTQLERVTKLMGSGESLVNVQVGKTHYRACYCVKNPGCEIWGLWTHLLGPVVQLDSFCQCCPPPPPPKFKFDLPSRIPIGK
jgi:hypothetical protein